MSLRLPPDLLERVSEVAHRKKRSINGQIEKVIQDWIDRKDAHALQTSLDYNELGGVDEEDQEAPINEEDQETLTDEADHEVLSAPPRKRRKR